MIPLAMIVIDEFLEGRLKWCSPSGTIRSGHSCVIDRHQSFGIGARIGRLKQCLHDVHSGLVQQAAHIRAPLRSRGRDQHPMIAQHAVACGERAADLAHEESLGCGVDPTI
jgi:hypothetical protein